MNVQLLFHDDGSRADDAPGVLYDDIVVGSLAVRVHLVVALVELVLRLVPRPGEILEACEEALGVVSLFEGPDGEAFWEGGGDL